MKRNLMKVVLLTVTAILSSLQVAGLQANTVDAVMKVSQAKTQAAKKSQARIDKLSEQTGDLLDQYKVVHKQIDGLRVYNTRLEKQIANQKARILEIDSSIAQVTVIQRQIMPLIIRMIDSLDSFVELDVPFHARERRDRIEFLRANLDRSDLTVAEKFRQVLEAYKIENEYGRKIDTYVDTIEVEGVEREVNIFRVGRIALLYQTTDTEISGAWDNKAGQWVKLDSGEYRSAIQQGIRIANKQASIDILTLPVAAPEAAQ